MLIYEVAFSSFSNINQSATAYSTPDLIMNKQSEFDWVAFLRKLGISNKWEDNSNVNMSYLYYECTYFFCFKVLFYDDLD